jgi:hypothetical protein
LLANAASRNELQLACCSASYQSVDTMSTGGERPARAA